ncbi:hypothetical protein FB45DRAFT_1056568 [Roridomyces roridus]|uniref:Uncharacterized protein n=1 Tax=Roridomyces roridus TaxID=1738132 RepID=A0AAD7BYU5_9AGAR|nr:hypothetical protein FB45DRAFT_1056568 [Roridomyces roridus]
MLTQSDIAKYLDQCTGPDAVLAIDEILSGYIVAKYIRGASAERVLLKLRGLVFYLRVTGRSHVLEVGADPFKALMEEVSLGGERVGILPALTSPGKAVWNHLRRNARGERGPSHPLLVTDPTYGGPGPARVFLSLPQSRPLHENETRTPWLQRYFATRLRAGDYAGESEPPDYGSQRTMTLPRYATNEEAAASVLVG